jgi:hyperosmotically inducible periplasmic protein
MRLIKHVGSILCVAAALVVVGCNRGGVPDPSDEVTRALKDANLDQVKIDWDKEAHVAHLKGTVDRPTDRQRAEEVASAAVGTSGRVLNEVTVKGLNDKTAGDLDGSIKSTLKKMINEEPALRERDIDFDVNNGVVTVKGEVRSAAEKNRVTDLVRSAPGVKDFANALEIKTR